MVVRACVCIHVTQDAIRTYEAGRLITCVDAAKKRHGKAVKLICETGACGSLQGECNTLTVKLSDEKCEALRKEYKVSVVLPSAARGAVQHAL